MFTRLLVEELEFTKNSVTGSRGLFRGAVPRRVGSGCFKSLHKAMFGLPKQKPYRDLQT